MTIPTASLFDSPILPVLKSAKYKGHLLVDYHALNYCDASHQGPRSQHPIVLNLLTLFNQQLLNISLLWIGLTHSVQCLFPQLLICGLPSSLKGHNAPSPAFAWAPQLCCHPMWSLQTRSSLRPPFSRSTDTTSH